MAGASEVADLYIRLRMVGDQFTGSIHGMAADAETFTGRMQAGFAALTKAGFAVGAGIVGLLAKTTDMASDFEAKMELVHSQAGASQAEVDALKQKVLDLAPAVGIGPEQLADGLYHVESAGFRGSQALDITRAAAQGAALGMADMESVTQALIGTMAVGLKDVSGASDAIAYLNRIVGIGDMRMEKLSQAIATGVLPSFKSAGLGMADFGAALATLTDNVTPADEAATRLRMTVSMMSAPSGPAKKALASIGIEATQLADDLRKPNGLLVAVDDLKSHLADSGKTASEQNAVLQRAFGGGQTSGAILTLIGETDRLRDKYHELGTASTRAAQLQDAWTSTQQTARQQLHEVVAQFQTWGVEIGNLVLPRLKTLLGWVNQGIAWLKEHREAALALAVLFGTVLAAALTAATVAVVTFTVALLTNPVFLIVAAIALLVVGIVEMVRHWDLVKEKFQEVWGWISTQWDSYVVGPANVAYEKLQAIWGAVADWFKGVFGAVGDGLSGAWNWVTNTAPVKFAKEMVRDFVDFWRDHGEELITIARYIWRLIWLTIQERLNSILITLRTALDLLKIAWNIAWNAVVGALQVVWQLIVDIVTGDLKILLDVVQIGWNVLVTAAKVVWDLFTGIVKTAWDLITGIVRTAVETVLAIIGFWADLLTGHWSKLWGDIKNIFGSLVGGILSTIGSFFANVGVTAFKAGRDLLVGIWNGAVGSWHLLTDLLTSIFTTIGHFFEGSGKWLVQTGKNLIIGLWNGIVDMAQWLYDQIATFGGYVVGAVKSALGIHSPSTYTREHGRYLVEGLAAGIVENTGLAVSAARDLAAQVLGAGSASLAVGVSGNAVRGLGSGALAPAGIGARATPPIEVALTNHTYLDGRQVHASTQRRTLRDERRNTNNGLSRLGGRSK